jgi:predicted CoA-substrate-specific enzyme activase
MIVAGIDIGSRSIELVLLENGEVVSSRREDSTFNPLAQCRRMLDGCSFDTLVATGYGRNLLNGDLGGLNITEIQAYALGARHLYPGCCTILDIGGQDAKAIALDDRGGVMKFEMNDRCAAGTGKFLEFMATSFQLPLEEFGHFALKGNEGISINSMCTVFAESEVTSLIARGANAEDVALAVHASIVRRSLGMLRRVTKATPLVFAGGVARNACITELVRRSTSGEVLVPEEPDVVGALGAALYAARFQTLPVR